MKVNKKMYRDASKIVPTEYQYPEKIPTYKIVKPHIKSVNIVVTIMDEI